MPASRFPAQTPPSHGSQGCLRHKKPRGRFTGLGPQSGRSGFAALPSLTDPLSPVHPRPIIAGGLLQARRSSPLVFSHGRYTQRKENTMAALSSHSSKLFGAERPFFATKECLDDMRALSSVSFAHGDLSIGRYRRDRPGLGITPRNPLSATVMAVVLLRPLPALRGWNDGQLLEMPARGVGALSCLDLRETWTMDLTDPFDSLNTYIPLTAFDEITSELKRPRIERWNSLLCVEHLDATMLNLMRALSPVLASPEQATALFVDHVFLAIVAHLAATYGGQKSDMPAFAGRRDRMLTHLQERRVTSRLLDNLGTDTKLAELAALC